MAKTTIDELKKQHPKGTLVEFQDGEWAFFKQPTRQVVGMAMSKARNNPLDLVQVLVTNCLVDSSPNLDLKGDDGIGYLVGLAEQVDAIIGTKKAEVKN